MGNRKSRQKYNPSEEVKNITTILKKLHGRSSSLKLPKCFDKCLGCAKVDCSKCSKITKKFIQLLELFLDQFQTVGVGIYEIFL